MSKKYTLGTFRFNKGMRILQGLIGIILIILFHKFIIMEGLQIARITKIIITILLVVAVILVFKVLKNEIMQLILSFKPKECFMDIEKECMLYSWEGFGKVPEYGVKAIKYIEYNREKIVVQVENND